MSRQLMVVTVTLEDRSDGGLFVTSEMLPGLILSGSNREAIAANIAPAIQALLERKGYKIGGVYPDQPIPDVMRQPSPRTVDMHIHRQFVVEYQAAA